MIGEEHVLDTELLCGASSRYSRTDQVYRSVVICMRTKQCLWCSWEIIESDLVWWVSVSFFFLFLKYI